MDAAATRSKVRETAELVARRLRASVASVAARAGQVPAAKAATAVECALTIALATVCAQIVWDVVEPMPSATANEAAISSPHQAAISRFTVLTSTDPFHRAPGAAVTDAPGPARAPETMLSLELFGIRAGGGQGGSVIIGTPDNRQDVYYTGEEILTGVRLERILRDRVEIRRNGVVETLSFAQDHKKTASASSQNPAPDASAGPGQVAANLRRFLSVVRFVPGEGGKGLAISETSDRALLRQAGLEQGDIVLSVNGLAADNIGALRGLADAGVRTLTLEIERRGERKLHTFKVDQP